MTTSCFILSLTFSWILLFNTFKSQCKCVKKVDRMFVYFFLGGGGLELHVIPHQSTLYV